MEGKSPGAPKGSPRLPAEKPGLPRSASVLLSGLNLPCLHAGWREQVSADHTADFQISWCPPTLSAHDMQALSG